MNTNKGLTTLTAVKLLRLGYVLLVVAVVDFGLALASLIDHLSPGDGIWLIPVIFLSAVSGVLIALFWLLRLIWLFIANDPEPAPISLRTLNVTFSCLAILVAFEAIVYYVTH